MAYQETDPPADVVAGITRVSDFHARTLFDTGASHSFISHEFANSHNLERPPLRNVVSVSTPGGPIEANDFVFSCPIRLGRMPCPWSLIVIPLKEYDVILGMDWLTEYRALIDCEKRQV